MAEPTPQNEINLFSHVQVLYHWRRFIIINVLIFAVITAVIVFLLPNEYMATASILPPQKESGLGSTISQLTKGIIPSGLLGQAGASQGAYNYLAILESRSAMEEIVKRNDLLNVYEVDTVMSKAVGLLSDNSAFEIGENGNILISVSDKNPKRAAKMANDYVDVLNEISIDLSTQEARNNRKFIEKRYVQAQTDIHDLEDSIQAFQSKYGLVSLPDQTTAAIQAAADLQGQLSVAEIERGVLQQSLGSDNAEVALKQAEINELKSKLLGMQSGERMEDERGLFPPLNQVPELSIQYLRLYRNYQIQAKLLEYIIPLYEQARVEENKNVPVVLVLDTAIPPRRKHWPPRTIIVLIVMITVFMISAGFIFLMEFIAQPRENTTEVEQKLVAVMQRVKRRYRIPT